MNPRDAVDVVDKAAAMSDRWLFLAALLIMLVFAWLVIKYLVAQNESQRIAHAATQKDLTEKVLGVVFEATAVMKDLKDVLNDKRPLVVFVFAILFLSLGGCAHTDLYERGQRIAHFEGDMKDVHYEHRADGTTILTGVDINHSAATLAQGKAATDKITGLGAALAASGIMGALK